MDADTLRHRPTPEDDWQAGKILQAMPRGLYRVQLEDGREVTAHRAGTVRLAQTRLLPATLVWVVLTTNDPTRGRVVAKR